jgi:hypothetical protein
LLIVPLAQPSGFQIFGGVVFRGQLNVRHGVCFAWCSKCPVVQRFKKVGIAKYKNNTMNNKVRVVFNNFI